jgi:hypothetical protein
MSAPERPRRRRVRPFLAIIACLALIGTTVYWFDLRPRHIRSACIHDAQLARRDEQYQWYEDQIQRSGSVQYWRGLQSQLVLGEYHEADYIRCIREHGLEP